MQRDKPGDGGQAKSCIVHGGIVNVTQHTSPIPLVHKLDYSDVIASRGNFAGEQPFVLTQTGDDALAICQ